ncbi:hypothetical protein CFK37_03535 [Virgibacillus phasianinus]|uniref:DUF4175 domain-containing protein n=1 Tax=Virgibacillus phasianinus TaxID=2017483 RepID=A0A220TZY8_9BACI|nr:hypothetical protein [Virgibacillus phasianinus]ASK61315.1 hypothetical protein CFK37_03535 [Virgibacillus phasianinus]
MKLKKVPFLLSFALASLLVVGTTAFAQESDGNGMSNMQNGNGMMKMMGNDNMGNMMVSMNSPEGKKMMNACGDFMNSYQSEKDKK